MAEGERKTPVALAICRGSPVHLHAPQIFVQNLKAEKLIFAPGFSYVKRFIGMCQ